MFLSLMFLALILTLISFNAQQAMIQFLNYTTNKLKLILKTVSYKHDTTDKLMRLRTILILRCNTTFKS